MCLFGTLEYQPQISRSNPFGLATRHPQNCQEGQGPTGCAPSAEGRRRRTCSLADACFYP
jgi:hypothetical protein